ncbi:unnamed protein product, partial [Urochloa humidicola]
TARRETVRLDASAATTSRPATAPAATSAVACRRHQRESGGAGFPHRHHLCPVPVAAAAHVNPVEPNAPAPPSPTRLSPPPALAAPPTSALPMSCLPSPSADEPPQSFLYSCKWRLSEAHSALVFGCNGVSAFR